MMISKKRDSHFSTLTFQLVLDPSSSLFWILLFSLCFNHAGRERHVKLFANQNQRYPPAKLVFFLLCNNTCWLANCIMQRDTRAVVLSTFFALNMLGTSWQIGQILIGFQFIYWLEDFFFVFFTYYIIFVVN